LDVRFRDDSFSKLRGRTEVEGEDVNCEASFRPIVMSGTQREQLCSPLKTSWGLNSSTLILDALNEAHIILLLISACFMASNYDRDEAWLDVVQG
jgi:hypothetical protein